MYIYRSTSFNQFVKLLSSVSGFKFFSYNAKLFYFILPGLITFPEFENVETGLIIDIMHLSLETPTPGRRGALDS